MFLLDTNVVSELRKAKSARADAHVVAWAKGCRSSSLFISAITLLELEIGILRVERRDHTQGEILRSWMQRHVLPAFAGRVLPVGTPVALQCARLHVPDLRSERDALIAATALVHGIAVVTRNVADFEPMGVGILNPWVAEPGGNGS